MICLSVIVVNRIIFVIYLVNSDMYNVHDGSSKASEYYVVISCDDTQTKLFYGSL